MRSGKDFSADCGNSTSSSLRTTGASTQHSLNYFLKAIVVSLLKLLLSVKFMHLIVSKDGKSHVPDVAVLAAALFGL